jgi:DNA polymerase III psi subunit
MTISQRQFILLSEMGVSLWQRRILSTETLSQQRQQTNTAELPSSQKNNNNIDKQVSANSDNIKSVSTTTTTQTMNIDLANLKQQSIFNDILLSLQLLDEKVELIDNELIFKDLIWQFTATKQISFTKNTIKTPTLAVIAQSAPLKSALWQAIQKQTSHEQNSQEAQ